MAASKTDGRPLVVAALLVALAATPLPAAAPLRSFPAAREAAGARGVPLAVCVHGAQWHQASRAFLEKVWRSEALARELDEPVVLAEIGVGQALDEAETKKQADETEGWDPGPVRTFPAVQVFAADGRLLRTIGGAEFLAIADSPAAVAAAIDRVAAAARRRAELRTLLEGLKERPEEFRRQFLLLCELPLDPQPEDLALLKAVDPDDTLGLAGPLQFGGWNFIRETAGRAADGVTDDELAAIDRMLANDLYAPGQRAILWCGKGMLLAAAGRAAEAWEAYREGQRADPDGPNGKAVLRHGHRTVGRILRVGPDPDSPLAARLTGGNLSADPRVTIRLSSRDPAYDDPDGHASLCRGAPREYAFHTTDEAGPFVVIDLGDPCHVEAVEVLNRGSNAQRAAGLTLWLSPDGEVWRECWQATDVRQDWMIDLTAVEGGGLPARYLKLGLPAGQRGMLHLRAVNVFGRRGDRDGKAPAGAVPGR